MRTITVAFANGMNAASLPFSNFGRRAIAWLARRAAAPPVPTPPPASIAFAFDGEPGFVDGFEGLPLPLLRVHGWCGASDLPAFELDTLARRGLRPVAVQREARPDVLAAGSSRSLFCGFRATFVLDPGEIPLSLRVGDLRAIVPEAHSYSAVEPHYFSLFRETRMLGRQHIYGSGPPVDVSAEFKAFAALARGRILDFGCGNGDLVLHLRDLGAEAYGLELSSQRDRGAIKPGAAAMVSFYDGERPLPFADASFDAIVSTEVIEHVPGIDAYIGEFGRILRDGGRMLVTTPDISSIPSSFLANCVPWHLLESTHVNFFTPASVEQLFASHFELESAYSLGAGRVNGLFVPGSVGAVFVKRRAALP